MLTGVSGSGKSDLALRLIDRGAALVSDDYTVLTRVSETLLAAPPATIAGQMEVRGIGIVSAPFVESVPVILVVRLGEAPERMPEARFAAIEGVAVAEILLDAFEPSAPIKVEMALYRAKEGA